MEAGTMSEERRTHLVEMTCSCGNLTNMVAGVTNPRCLDCIRRQHGMRDELSGVPIGCHAPRVARVLPGELDWPIVVVPNVYPMRVQPPSWPATDPIPEVLNSDPRPDMPVPGPVSLLERLGEREGWEVRSGYSTGPERAVKVGTYKQTETWGVWSAPYPDTGWRWNAVYSRTVGKSWAWRSTAIWLPGKRPRFTHATRTDLTEFIIAGGEVGNVWFKAVHARVEEAAERAREAARKRPRARKEGTS